MELEIKGPKTKANRLYDDKIDLKDRAEGQKSIEPRLYMRPLISLRNTQVVKGRELSGESLSDLTSGLPNLPICWQTTIFAVALCHVLPLQKMKETRRKSTR